MNVMDGFTNDFTLYTPKISFEDRKMFKRSLTKSEIQKCSVRKQRLITKDSDKVMFQNHHFEFKRVIELNGIMCMASLTFLNSEVIATVSITGNELASSFKISFIPLKKKFKDFILIYEINKLKLCVYNKDEFEEFLKISENFKYYIVNLKGKYIRVDDFDDESELTMFSKIGVEDIGTKIKFVLLPQCPPSHNNENNEITQTDYSSSFMRYSYEPNLKYCEVDKLEIKSFLYQNSRDNSDIKFFIEECIVCTDYSETTDILKEADLLCSQLNVPSLTDQNLITKNLPLSKRFTLLSSKSSIHDEQSEEKEIMSRLQSEKSHMKIYLKLMKRIYEKDQKDSELLKLGIPPQSYFDLKTTTSHSRFARKTSLKQRSETKTNLTSYQHVYTK